MDPATTPPNTSTYPEKQHRRVAAGTVFSMRGQDSAQSPLLQTDAQDDELKCIRCSPSTNSPATPVSKSRDHRQRLGQKLLFVAQVLIFVLVILQFIMMYKKYAFACGAAAVIGSEAAIVGYYSSSSSLPDYYVTKPELFPGKHSLQDMRGVDEKLY